MIRSFRHRGLKRLYERDDASRVKPAHAARLRRILLVLNNADGPEDADVAGFKLHRLQPRKDGRWSVWVSGNWRVTFGFEGTDVVDVNYEDYH